MWKQVTTASVLTLVVTSAAAVRLGVEAGLRRTGDLSRLEGLAGTGLENLNDSSSRSTLPIIGTVTFKF